jgi:hypothetical protein
MRRSTSITRQPAARSDVCAFQEHEGEIAAEFRTVPQTSALSISGVVSLDALVLDDPPFDEPTGMVAANGLRLAGSTGVLHATDVPGRRTARSWCLLAPVAERLAAVGRSRP